MKEKIISLILLLGFLISVSLIILGQKNISTTGFTNEIIGLIGLLTVLCVYNRKYRKINMFR